jgi:low temperature requirement protein LtrA
VSNGRNLLRRRTEHGHARVTSVELFFDLVFVFAITQLSHFLLEHFTPLGAVHTALLLMAVWWVWVYTTWITNWLDPQQLPVRVALLAIMLVGLVMSASIPEAFDGRGLAFAAAYAGIQVGRTAFMLWALGSSDGVLTRNFQRILVWFGLSGVLWIAGGLAQGGLRLGLWASAIVLDYLGPFAGFWLPILGRSRPGEWTIEGAHLAERCGLFIIIALGESILVTGATFSGLQWSGASRAAFGAAFVGSVAMWWIYFVASAEAASARISASRDPGRLGRSAYTYVHLLLVAGIIVAAVGDETVLAHPLQHTELETGLSVLGGPALFLIGNASFQWAISRTLAVSHGAGLVALALLVPLSPAVPPLALLAAAAGVLAGVAAWEEWSNPSCRET